MDAMLRALTKELGNYPVLEDLEKGTGLGKLSALVLAGPVFLLARFAFGIQAAAVLCNVVGFLYPAIASVRALQTPSKVDDTLWLTYFVVLAAFTIVEQLFLESLLEVFPFYYAFKFGWLIWAQAPSSNGAVFVYSHIFMPFIKTHSVAPNTPRTRPRSLPSKAQ
ncbi:hypothetical protein BASA81_006791 [Batrachochytrium salamandrivorans]|nr:hypothetical protein BASA81_006791 [Batrachochytrium salamandrivorans]